MSGPESSGAQGEALHPVAEQAWQHARIEGQRDWIEHNLARYLATLEPQELAWAVRSLLAVAAYLEIEERDVAAADCLVRAVKTAAPALEQAMAEAQSLHTEAGETAVQRLRDFSDVKPERAPAEDEPPPSGTIRLRTIMPRTRIG